MRSSDTRAAAQVSRICIRHSDLFPDYIAAPDFGVGAPYFYRVPQAGKAFEHTLFTSPSLLRQLADERGINERPEFPMYMAFADAAPASGEAETYVEVNYSSACTAQWTYDTALGVWDRGIGGRPHVDALTGDQITADNVVLVFANHVHANFWEQMIGDQSAWILSTEIQLWGQGPALVFRDGQMYSGIWKRETRDAMLTFYYADETPLPLKPGNTWFQVVPLGTESSQIGEGQAIVQVAEAIRRHAMKVGVVFPQTEIGADVNFRAPVRSRRRGPGLRLSARL